MAAGSFSYFVNWSHSNHTDTSIQHLLSGTELNVGETETDLAHCLNVLTITVILVALRSINIYADVTLSRFLTWISHLLGSTIP